QQAGRERTRAGAELPDRVASAGVERLRHLSRQGAREEWRELGRGDEVAARRRHAAEDRTAARVVAEAGRVERERHEAAERNPAAGGVDGSADEAPQRRRYTDVIQAFAHPRIVGIVLTQPVSS